MNGLNESGLTCSFDLLDEIQKITHIQEFVAIRELFDGVVSRNVKQDDIVLRQNGCVYPDWKISLQLRLILKREREIITQHE